MVDDKIMLLCPKCKQIHRIDLSRFAIKCGFCGGPIKVRIREMKQDMKHYDTSKQIL